MTKKNATAKTKAINQSLRPFGLRSGLRQSGGRFAAGLGRGAESPALIPKAERQGQRLIPFGDDYKKSKRQQPRQRQKRNAGVLRCAQNDRQKRAEAKAGALGLGEGGGREADFSTALLTMKP